MDGGRKRTRKELLNWGFLRCTKKTPRWIKAVVFWWDHWLKKVKNILSGLPYRSALVESFTSKPWCIERIGSFGRQTPVTLDRFPHFRRLGGRAKTDTPLLITAIDIVYQGPGKLPLCKMVMVVCSFHHHHYGCVRVPRNERRKDARKLIPTAVAFHVVTGSPFWE